MENAIKMYQQSSGMLSFDLCWKKSRSKNTKEIRMLTIGKIGKLKALYTIWTNANSFNFTEWAGKIPLYASEPRYLDKSWLEN